MNIELQSTQHCFDRNEYNQFIIDNVVDHRGHESKVNCPICAKTAIRHNFEACHTGSVNQHYTLNCEHCGYHSCDQDVCKRCDEDAQDDTESNHYQFMQELDGLVDLALERLITDDNKVFTAIRKRLHQDEHEIDFNWFYFSDKSTNRFNFMTYLLIEVMDRTFDIWLDKQVELFKIS
ncbi:hypothetical protein [Shewanella algicola]|uniref:hypothetical protein n=1 Tax=Shewanella algicola TaxID=640633 RepID=UPI002495A2FD|nr:hypothetical protein [Shewanella algicola]